MIFVLTIFSVMSQDNIVFLQKYGKSSIPINTIDSILPQKQGLYNIYLLGRHEPISIVADTALYGTQLSDTIIIDFNENWVTTTNPHLDWLTMDVQGTRVNVSSSGKRPFTCLVRGQCSNGMLTLQNDTTTTLILDGLHLTNLEGSAINLTEKQTTIFELKNETANFLADGQTYNSLYKTNACLYSKGSMIFNGQGSLTVTGNYRHAISSSKNITVNSGDIIIQNTLKDGIHCDKYRQNGGIMELHLLNPATKGIKVKELFELTGGYITGEALGNLAIEDGETTYCTLIKSDSACVIQGGSLNLTHNGNGGRCISVDAELLIRGGVLDLKCHGNGGAYLTALNDSDYYTPKCITVDGNVQIQRGHVRLLSTGQGGKGIDCSDSIFVGINGEEIIGEDSLLIEIETQGNAIVENVIEDYLHGSPKAMKADKAIELYSGNLRIKTLGSGGEGIECKGSLRAYNATIIADCYDDGINTGQRCYIKGAHIFCRSLNNDGIDSNGKLSVHDGVVAAISEHFMNESFDTEGGRLYVYGGQVIGIGHNEVLIGEQTTVPYYTTRMKINDWGVRYGDSINLNTKQYLAISKGLHNVISFYHESSFEDAFITIASPNLTYDEQYQISDSNPPTNPVESLFDSRVLLGGLIDERDILYNFNPY